MNPPKISFLFSVISFVCLIGAASASAQVEAKQIEPSYEAVLQLIVGSSDASVKNDIPQNLTNVSRQIKSNFAFANYRLASTFIGRVANNGSFEYKSVSDMFGQESANDAQTFLEWTLGSLKGMPDAAGKNSFQAQPFRFGARVPVKTGGGVVNYEYVGLTMNRVSLGENRPTLIGTLTLPKTSGTLFLILTIKAVEN